MTLTMRKYESESDYHKIREFLKDVFLLNKRREICWQRYRFDYWRYLGTMCLGHGSLENDVYIWETPEHEIASVLHPEAPGSVFLQVHPELSSYATEEEMIGVAEDHLAVTRDAQVRRVGIWAREDDTGRQEILARRGFQKSEATDWQRYRSLADEIPERPIVPGYQIRPLAGEHELPDRSYISWRAFHPDDPPEAYQGWEWYRNVQAAPLYRQDLDLVVEASDGQLVSFGTIWLDEETGCAAFEPMGTVPEHQRRGLAASLMCEGLRRLRELGAEKTFVGAWNEATNRLYGDVAGFRGYTKLVRWGCER